jgi:septum site-determining protein MinC
MSEDVVLKGNRFGVKLVFNEKVDFGLVLQKLKAKLVEAKGFFVKGTTFIVDERVSDEQREALRTLLGEFELKLDINAPKEKIETETKPERKKSGEIKIIRGTVRGGQIIEWDGSVVIFGNVNPGAKIVAGGNIIVKGTCRGFVHAGAYGDKDATVIAEKMMAGQIRIADIIACAPDKLEPAEKVECAKIRDNNIIIEPIEQREVC